MSHQEFTALKALENNPGYRLLQESWLGQLIEIERQQDMKAKTGNESAWRYWAGQVAGFKLAMSTLARALSELEKESGATDVDARIGKLLNEVSGGNGQ